MKITDLAQHLHELRSARTGRPIGAAMSVMEVWAGVIESPHSGIKEIRYFEANLPRPFDGMFVRLRSQVGSGEIAGIYVHKALPKHWREFVAIKEMMHCWYPGTSYDGTPADARNLVDALVSETSRYTSSVAADRTAIVAAAEVILPSFTVERHIKQGHDHNQIAVSHGLHPDVVEMICTLDMLHSRINGEI